MSVIIKGLGSSSTVLVKGFSGGFKEIILKVVHIVSKITDILSF
jgi:hypothetical protein